MEEVNDHTSCLALFSIEIHLATKTDFLLRIISYLLLCYKVINNFSRMKNAVVVTSYCLQTTSFCLHFYVKNIK